MEFENLITLIKAVSDSELTGFKYEEKGVKIQLSKQVIQAEAGQVIQTQQSAVPFMQTLEPQAQAVTDIMQETGKAETGNVIESPLVGTFYSAPSEDAAPFVAVGDTVKKGQTLAIIEAMKLMNEIESDYDGTVTEILVQNGQAVEYGQPLFRIS